VSPSVSVVSKSVLPSFTCGSSSPISFKNGIVYVKPAPCKFAVISALFTTAPLSNNAVNVGSGSFPHLLINISSSKGIPKYFPALYKTSYN
jgi:hypothetical protein